MRKLAEIVAGRRTKWLVILAWLVLLFALAPLGGKLGDETNDETESFLPASAESTEVVRLLDTEFASGGRPRTGSSSTSARAASRQADQAKIAPTPGAWRPKLPVTRPPVVPVRGRRAEALVAPRGASPTRS